MGVSVRGLVWKTPARDLNKTVLTYLRFDFDFDKLVRS